MVLNTTEAWRYFDPHFLLPILDFVEQRGMCPKFEVDKARIKAVSGTCMVDYLQTLCEEANLPVPEGLEGKKANVMAAYHDQQLPLVPLLEVIERSGVDSLKTMTLADLCLKFDLPADILDTLFEYARLSYQVGDYGKSSELLQIYRTLTSWNETSSIPTERQLRALWGSAASFIVQQDYERAIEVLIKLIEFFDNSTLPKDKFSYGASLLWLLHWSLLAAFKSPQFPSQLVPLLLRDKFLNIVSISAPYLWKYIAAMVILADDPTVRRGEIAAMIKRDNGPLAQFVVDMYSLFDFAAAETQIDSFLFEEDYLLTDHETELKTQARKLVQEANSRIYM